LVKLIAGLSMFPREQQLTMVRAMDVADDTWSEAAVVKDAQRRQGILRQHLSRVAAERAQRMQELERTIGATKQNGEAVLAELDKRIAELHARRDQEAATTAAEVAKIEQQQRELEAKETRSRQGAAQVIQALSGLLTFLGAPQAGEPR
jgi:chromosome segregation ATPase